MFEARNRVGLHQTDWKDIYIYKYEAVEKTGIIPQLKPICAFVSSAVDRAPAIRYLTWWTEK